VQRQHNAQNQQVFQSHAGGYPSGMGLLLCIVVCVETTMFFLLCHYISDY
jgi:hypothetical protein